MVNVVQCQPGRKLVLCLDALCQVGESWLDMGAGPLYWEAWKVHFALEAEDMECLWSDGQTGAIGPPVP